jgi:hypothetical protein
MLVAAALIAAMALDGGKGRYLLALVATYRALAVPVRCRESVRRRRPP